MHSDDLPTPKGLLIVAFIDVILFAIQKFVGVLSVLSLLIVGFGGLLAIWLHDRRYAKTFWLTIIVGALVVGYLTIKEMSRPSAPSSVSEDAPKPALKQLMYRICDAELMHMPKDNRLLRFAIEIDPINPNSEQVHVVAKHSFLIFDDLPSKVDQAALSIDLTPQANVVAKTKVPNFKDYIVFSPPRLEKGPKFGRYHYEYRFGPDEDTATHPVEINGTIEADFDDEGRLTGEVHFIPSGDKNISFDPTVCPFSW